jgi:hypothetical protein
MNTSELWHFLPRGYLVSIAVETPVLLIGLSRRHNLTRRLFAGVWLTACSYPIVNLVIAVLLPNPEWLFLTVGESFAAISECALFAAAFYRRGDPEPRARIQDMATIILANLASFGFGEWAVYIGWKWLVGTGG